MMCAVDSGCNMLQISCRCVFPMILLHLDLHNRSFSVDFGAVVLKIHMEWTILNQSSQIISARCGTHLHKALPTRRLNSWLLLTAAPDLLWKAGTCDRCFQYETIQNISKQWQPKGMWIKTVTTQKKCGFKQWQPKEMWIKTVTTQRNTNYIPTKQQLLVSRVSKVSDTSQRGTHAVSGTVIILIRGALRNPVCQRNSVKWGFGRRIICKSGCKTLHRTIMQLIELSICKTWVSYYLKK